MAGALLLSLFVLYCFVAQAQLLMVIELCRHGDRSPLNTYPYDPLPYSQWQAGAGQLTAQGMRAHYELGRQLRERYTSSGFLSKNFSVNELKVISSDTDRTLMSAYCQLAGLFPYDTGPIISETTSEPLFALPFFWQPVPIHSDVSNNDTMIKVGNSCPRYHEILKRLRQTPEWSLKTKEQSNLLQKVANITGIVDCSLDDLGKVLDVWTCDRAHQIAIPGVTDEDYIQVESTFSWVYKRDYEGKEVQKLLAGLLISDILFHMKEKVENKTELKFILYSGHDTTLAALLSCFQAFSGLNPPYNSTIIIELHKGNEMLDAGSEGDHFVHIEYNGNDIAIPSCSSFCPFESFARYLEDMSLSFEERQNMCSLKSTRNFLTSKALSLKTSLLVLIGFLILLGSIAVGIAWKRARLRMRTLIAEETQGPLLMSDG
eukprot:jgi/Galph1/4827/GphlegSOOS_G3493.1